MSKEELVNKIKKELLKSGFPLELRCRKVLFERKWGFTFDRFYTDAEGTEHEIDALAFTRTFFDGSDNVVQSNLIVECKKNDSNPWVFFHEISVPAFLSVRSTLGTEEDMKLATMFFSAKPTSPILEHHYYQAQSVTSYSMAFKSDRIKNQIYEALQQVIGGHDSSWESHIKYNFSMPTEKRIMVDVYYPAVVFDGRLFLAKLVGDDLQLDETGHVLYTTQRPFRTDGRTTHISVDIVRADLFSEYLAKLEKDHEIIVSYVLSKGGQ